MDDVLTFWFEELTTKQWFQKSDELDQRIYARFADVHQRICAGECWTWRHHPRGRLAEILVLDQFSRNMFRGRPEAFASDALALVLAQEAVHAGDDARLNPEERVFLYMPYMHSESSVVHEEAVRLFQDLPNLDYELRHKAIIDRFGRYPHRNDILGRISTPEETEWMKTNRGF